MKGSMCKKVSCCLLTAMLLLSGCLLPQSAFAETTEIPVYADIAAYTADFEITESLMMRSDASNNLLIDELNISNTRMTETNLNVTEIDVAPAQGWNIVQADTDLSGVMDQRAFSITVLGHDFFSGAYTEAITVAEGETQSINFSGKIGRFSQDILEQAAVITVTTEAVDAVKTYAVYTARDSLMRIYRTTDVIIEGETYDNRIADKVFTDFVDTVFTESNLPPWSDYSKKIINVVVETPVYPKSTAYWFYDMWPCKNLYLENLDTSRVTDMTGMFSYAGYEEEKFTIHGLEDFNTSGVRTMKNMFYCAGPWADWDYDISGWNTSNVRDMSGMFYNTAYIMTDCYNLGDLGSWDVSNVTDMSMMFWNAGKASAEGETWNIGDISGWNVENVTDYTDFSKGVETRFTPPSFAAAVTEDIQSGGEV